MIRLFDLLWQNKFSVGRHISLLFMIQTYVIMLYIVFRAVI